MHENKNDLLSSLLFILYLAFLTSLIFSFRAISSISIPFILITGIIKNRIEEKTFFNAGLKHPFVIACTLFFLAQFISVVYTTNAHQAWRNIFLKSCLVAVPGAVFCCNYLDKITRKKILKWYCLILFAACLVAISHALYVYSNNHNYSVFLYHSLVMIYSGHAIQFSVLVFVALVYLFELLKEKDIFLNRYVHFCLIAFLLVFLFLLSSKLVISFFILYFLFFTIRSLVLHAATKKIAYALGIAFIILSSIVLFTKNPINNRFREIAQTDFNFINKEKYDPGLYFNGLQFRMLQWRFVPQILNEHKAWMTGMSVGDAQADLNQKYIESRMYVGSPERGDKGFIGYNTHNEFLESLLQTGIPGLILFVLITWALLKMVWERKTTGLSFVTILLILYSFDESVLETQYSILIFLFFPSFFYHEKI